MVAFGLEEGIVRWFVHKGGTPEGPFEEARVLEMIRAGQVPPTAHVCAEGGQQWSPVSSHPAFAQTCAVGGTCPA
ncbi:MAG: DUF4339 domain-containing protein, partial [Sandaracinaceae bacterium]|nr:DUF4339 domain-containing protein [Sandaracinaceae bacterium]